MWKKALGVVALLLVSVVIAGVTWVGPRNVVGMLRYDQRQEGALRVGDAAPDVALNALDGGRQVMLCEAGGPRPLVLIFGSFT